MPRKAAVAQTAGAVSLKIVQFPELPPKGDVSDFIANGRAMDELLARIDTAPLWSPPSGAPSVPSVPDNPGDDFSACHLVMRCMADIQPEKIEWLWPGRIAIGKQTLIGGEPGLGKSQIATALAATVTTASNWPCDEGRAPLGSVLILSAEDDAGDTIRPRLDAAGADVTAVHQISAVCQRDGKGRRTFNLQADLALMEAAIERLGNVRLVIIDPVSSYLGKVDSHKNSDVRGALEPLGDMASRTSGRGGFDHALLQRCSGNPPSTASSARLLSLLPPEPPSSSPAIPTIPIRHGAFSSRPRII